MTPLVHLYAYAKMQKGPSVLLDHGELAECSTTCKRQWGSDPCRGPLHRASEAPCK